MAGRKEKKRPIVMVSSSVYGQEELLNRVYDLLTSMGYEVWMSHKGTLPVNSTEDTLSLCLDAVEKCDLFLGMITPFYGTTKQGEISVTHAEMRKAKELNKPRWFLVHENVVFARQLLKNLGYANPDERKQLTLKRNTIFSDLRIIDLYEEMQGIVKKAAPKTDATVPSSTEVEQGTRWVQTYRQDDDAVLFTDAQFSRYQEVENLLNTYLPLTEQLRKRLEGQGE